MAWPSPLSLIDQLETDLLPEFRDEDGFGLSYRAEYIAQDDDEPPTLEVTITEEIPFVFHGIMNPMRMVGMTTILPFEMECTQLSSTYNWRRFLRGRKSRKEMNITARLAAAKASKAVRVRARLAEIRRERRERILSEMGASIRVVGGI